MSQVIVYTNDNGGVSLTIPTGEIPIDEVLAKDCPAGAVIIDDSFLPQGDDANYFNAWVLVNGVVSVDIDKKEEIILKQQQQITAKQSALSKLTALGLTENEIKALTGTL